MIATSLLAAREGWSERQLSGFFHSLLDKPFKSKENGMAQIILKQEARMEQDIQDLADFLDVPVDELWGNVFGS